MSASSRKRQKTAACSNISRPETPVSVYKQALRLVRQQPCGDTTADASIAEKLQRVTQLITNSPQFEQQLQQTAEHSLDLELADEPLFLLASAHLQLGLLYQRQDQLHAAEEQYRTCLKYFPRFVAALSALGQVLKCSAASAEELPEAEQVLYQAIDVAQQLSEAQGGLLVDSNKACAGEVDAADGARSALAMLLCQAGRDAEAAPHLRALGFRFRLSAEVLHYPVPGVEQDTTTNSHQTQHAEEGGPSSTSIATTSSSSTYLQTVDSAVPQQLLHHLRHVFRPGADFWLQHSYGRVGYFSYYFQLLDSPTSSMHQLARYLQHLAARYFPAVQEAKYAEFWAHCRRHSSGHQLHFDSDDEGQGGVRHPIITAIVYLSPNTHSSRNTNADSNGAGAVEGSSSKGGSQQSFIGGPTLMTDQVLGGPLASRGWLAYPADNRVVFFDGRFLHGVVPGRGPSPSPDGRRCTLMMAFWRELKCRTPAGASVGACMPMPDPSASAEAGSVSIMRTWHQELQPLSGDWEASDPVPVHKLQPVSAVWQAVDAGGSTKGAAYQYCFQGF